MSLLEDGGSSSTDGIGTRCAALDLEADDTALRQTEIAEHGSQVPMVETCPERPTPKEVEAHQVSCHAE